MGLGTGKCGLGNAPSSAKIPLDLAASRVNRLRVPPSNLYSNQPSWLHWLRRHLLLLVCGQIGRFSKRKQSFNSIKLAVRSGGHHCHLARRVCIVYRDESIESCFAYSLTLLPPLRDDT